MITAVNMKSTAHGVLAVDYPKQALAVVYRVLENKKFFNLKNEEYRDGIKRKETR